MRTVIPMTRKVVAVLCILIFTFSSARAVDAMLTGDTFVSSSTPNVVNSAAYFLSVSTNSRSFLQFDLSPLPTNTTGAGIQKAVLRIFVNQVTRAGTFNVFTSSSNWSEATLRFTGAPTNGTLEAVGFPVTTNSVNNELMVDVTPLVKDWVDRVDPNRGIILASTTANFTFVSKESPTLTRPARLEITLAGSGSSIAGLDGKTVLNGTGIPAGTNGLVGDFYIDTAANKIYGPKATNGWGIGTSIVGPTGPQGSQGLKGDTGLTGPAGPKGDIGLTGAAGPAGPKGDTGLTGPAGSTGPQGLQGLKGDSGAIGATGAQGLKGDTGLTGPTGAKGDKGDTGPQGTQGLKGDNGLTGPAGPKGDTGITGPAGAKGDTGLTGPAGATGPQGIQGLKGDKGDTGAAGLKGDTGAVGPQGLQGLKGDKGDTGETGPSGSQGLKGDKGDTGATGATGPKGDTGLIGPVGATGPQGIQGLKGDKGDAGATGAQGPQGLKGDTGLTGLAGADGAVGPQGPQGLQGLKGDKGDTGATGPQGLKGDTGATGLQGPQGLKGDTGFAGPAGADGAVGPQGSQGLKGDKGDTGLTGATGLEGPQGLKGDKGDTGAPGPQGLQGPTGLTGAQGPAGPIGLTGPQGPAGTNGLNGTNGTNGNTVLNGSGAPSAGLGSVGDIYLDTASNNIYGPKTTNGWGSGTSIVGPKGLQGTSGLPDFGAYEAVTLGVTQQATSDGFLFLTVINDSVNDNNIGQIWLGKESNNLTTTFSVRQPYTSGHQSASFPIPNKYYYRVIGTKTTAQWLPVVKGALANSFGTLISGSGVPAASNGVVGDLYYDTNSISFYGPKTTNGWGSQISVVGPQGPVGTNGATGPQGPIGLTGPAGPTGATGPQGLQGIQGLTGATGPQGIQGLTGATGPMGPQGPAGTNGTNGATGPQGPQGPAGATGTAVSGGLVSQESLVAPSGYSLTYSKNGEWSSVGQSRGEYYYAAEMYSNNIYTIGGANRDGNPNSSYPWNLDASKKVYIYNIVSNSLTTGADMPVNIFSGASAIYNKKIYIFGGKTWYRFNGYGGMYDLLGNPNLVIYKYDINSNSWEYTVSVSQNMPSSKNSGSATVFNEKIYIAGGDTDAFYCYDPSSQTWSTLTKSPSTWGKIGFFSIGNTLLATTTSGLFSYNFNSNQWVQINNFNFSGGSSAPMGTTFLHVTGSKTYQVDPITGKMALKATRPNNSISDEILKNYNDNLYSIGREGWDVAPITSFNNLYSSTGAGGAVGAPIITGPAGATGPQGPAGPQGETGPAGATGAIGAAGPQGPQGIQGLTGLQGPSGPTGPQGPAGTNGINGTNGAGIISGAGAPSSTNYPLGSFYINTSSNSIFGPLTTNGWGSPTSLVGPQGATGLNVSREQLLIQPNPWIKPVGESFVGGAPYSWDVFAQETYIPSGTTNLIVKCNIDWSADYTRIDSPRSMNLSFSVIVNSSSIYTTNYPSATSATAISMYSNIDISSLNLTPGFHTFKVRATKSDYGDTRGAMIFRGDMGGNNCSVWLIGK